MNWADKMLLEYKEGRRELNRKARKLGHLDEDAEEKKQLNSMINEMAFVIEWLETGRQPHTMRGIDKGGAYHRRVLLDMEMFPCLDIEPEEKPLTNEQKQIIKDVLSLLSFRERQCFILSGAYGRTQEEIAEELGISRNTVKQSIARARKKIDNKIKAYDTQMTPKGALGCKGKLLI